VTASKTIVDEFGLSGSV